MSAEIKINESGTTLYIKLNDLPIYKREEIKGLIDYYALTVYIDWAEDGEIVGVQIS